MKPLKLETWEIKKPPYVRILSQSIAIYAPGLLESLRDIANNTLPKEFGQPSLRTWIKFYRSHRRLRHYFTEQFKLLGSLPALHAQVYHAITQQLDPGNHSETDTAPPVIPTVEEAYATFYSFVREDIADTPLLEKTKIIAQTTFLSPDFLFLMKIVLPVWLLYGKNPTIMYRQATQGDLQALEDLLRTDKMQVQNPRINKWIYFHACAKNKRKLTILLDAIGGRPRLRLSLQRVKYLLAGYISVSSELFGHRLTAPEIQSLFDAVAVDYGVDALRNPDLPDSPEAFSKAIQRERAFWSPILYPNRTKLSSEVSGWVFR